MRSLVASRPSAVAGCTAGAQSHLLRGDDPPGRLRVVSALARGEVVGRYQPGVPGSRQCRPPREATGRGRPAITPSAVGARMNSRSRPVIRSAPAYSVALSPDDVQPCPVGTGLLMQPAHDEQPGRTEQRPRPQRPAPAANPATVQPVSSIARRRFEQVHPPPDVAAPARIVQMPSQRHLGSGRPDPRIDDRRPDNGPNRDNPRSPGANARPASIHGASGGDKHPCRSSRRPPDSDRHPCRGVRR